MSLESTGRYQKAVYWEASGVDDYGNSTVKEAVELDVRWEETYREVLHDASPMTTNPGKKIAIIAVLTVDREIPQGSIFWKGALTDLVGTGSDIPNLCQVVTYDETPDAKGRNFSRSVTLMRARDSLPNLVSS